MKIYEIVELRPGAFAVGHRKKRWFRAPEWHSTVEPFDTVEQAREWIERYEANLNAPITSYPRTVCFGHVAADGRFHALRNDRSDR